MAIQGSIEEAGLPDVLQLLALGRKTGCLVVADGETLQGQIYLDVGRVSYATVSNRPNRLGDMLVKSGRITRQQLDQAVAEQTRTSGHQIGRILVDAGRLERAELERYIRLQVEEAVYLLFTWKQGTFNFTSDRLPPHQSLLVPLDTESLLLEGARRVDEWSLIEKKIPSLDLVYRRTRDNLGPVAEGLTEEQKRILPLLDGTLDVNGLVDATGMAEFDVGKALYGLITAGVVQLVERRSHVRHLEYRELLAYAVREAEFADAQRRKDAARHIVDCPICAERLRTMHIRSTTGALPLPGAEGQAEPPVEITVAAPPPQAPAAKVRDTAATSGLVERRTRERRGGPDRRKRERRTGIDRRRAVSTARPQASAERRAGPRREEDQRAGDSRDRRGGEKVQRSDSAAAAGSVSRTSQSGQPHPAVARGENWPHSDGQPVEVATGTERRPVVAKAESPTPKGDALTPAGAAPSPPSSPQTATPRSGGAPAEGQGESRGALEWVVSPEESLEMMRGSRTEARGGDAARRGAPRVAPQASGSPADRARAAVGNGASAVPGAGAGVRAPLSTGAPMLDRYAAGSDQAEAGEARRRAAQEGGRQAYPVKRLAIAAGIAFVAVLGFMAGQLGRKESASQLAQATATVGRSPASNVPQQPPAEARGSEAAPAGSVTQGADSSRPAATPAAVAPTRIETPARRAAEPAAPPRERPQPVTRAPAAAAPPAPQPTVPAAEAPPPQSAPTVGVVRGVVHDAGGRGVSGAHVSVRGTALSAVADGTGAFEIRDVPGGPVTVLASADGFVSGRADVRVEAGATVTADLALSRPHAAEPDEELAAGGWAPVDRAEATTILGGTLGAIEGLPIESIAKSTTAARPRVRVAQLTPAGERIVLTETRAGAAVRGGPGPAVVTALRVMSPSEAYPWSTATASFGNILISVKTGVAVDALRSMLARLGEVPQNQ